MTNAQGKSWQWARVLAAVALVLGLAWAGVAATATASAQQVGAQQPVIRYGLDPQLQTVGFEVLDQGKWKRLTFDHEGLTNTTVVKVDNDVAEFGSADGKWA